MDFKSINCKVNKLPEMQGTLAVLWCPAPYPPQGLEPYPNHKNNTRITRKAKWQDESPLLTTGKLQILCFLQAIGLQTGNILHLDILVIMLDMLEFKTTDFGYCISLLHVSPALVVLFQQLYPGIALAHADEEPRIGATETEKSNHSKHLPTCDLPDFCCWVCYCWT